MKAVRVAGLVVLAMTATLAGAQTVEVKEKPGCTPLFEKLLADGTIVEYEIDWELIVKTDSPDKFVYLVVAPSAEGLDKLTAVVRAAVSENPLLGSAFASMTVNQTPQIDILQVTAIYR